MKKTNMELVLRPYTFKSYQYLKMNWTELFSGTVVGAIVTQIGRISRDWLATKRSTKQYFMDTSALYTIGAEILGTTPMDRWTVGKVHNGGNKLNVLTESCYTILWEDFDKSLPPVKERFQKFPIDKSFNAMFKDAYLNGSAVVSRASLDEKDVLYSAMMNGRVKHTQMFFQLETKKALYFLSISSTVKDFDELSDFDKANIQISMERIRGVLMSSAKNL